MTVRIPPDRINKPAAVAGHEQRRPHRGLPGNDERRARRRDNTLPPTGATWRTPPSSSPVGLAEAARRRRCAPISADIAARGFAAVLAGAQAFGARQFFKFLYAEGLRADDPTGTLDSPQKDRPLPKTMSEAETGRLLDRAAAGGRDAAPAPARRLAALRLHALVEVLYATGLRVSELVACRSTVALRDERFFVVRGKGNKERMVPLSRQGARRRCAPGSPSATRDPGARRQPLPVSGRLRERLPAAPGLRPRPEGPGGARRHRRGEDLAACAAPRLRQPPAAERRRPARRAATARPCRHLDDADLHACAGGAAGAAGQRPSPACRPDAVTLCEGIVQTPESRRLRGPHVHRLPAHPGPRTNVQLPRFRKARSPTSKARSSS